jgi:hypothetical protein
MAMRQLMIANDLSRKMMAYGIIHTQIKDIPNLDYQKKPLYIDRGWKVEISSTQVTSPNLRLCNIVENVKNSMS